MRHSVFFRYATQQQYCLGQHKFGYRTGVGKRRVEYGNALFTRSVQVNLVGANAKAAYRRQLVRVRKHLGCQLGARANANKVRVCNFAKQRITVQCPTDAFDVAVTCGSQHFGR